MKFLKCMTCSKHFSSDSGNKLKIHSYITSPSTNITTILSYYVLNYTWHQQKFTCVKFIHPYMDAYIFHIWFTWLLLREFIRKVGQSGGIIVGSHFTRAKWNDHHNNWFSPFIMYLLFGSSSRNSWCVCQYA